MWKKRKFIVVAIIVAILLVGGIAGVAIAKTAGSSANPSTVEATSDNSTQGLMARVATILGIDQSTLQNAFDQAQKDMATQAMQNRLNSLVQQGKITQDQANEYQQWYQSRPDINVPGLMPNGPGRPGHFGRFGGFWMQKGTAPATPPPTTTP